ncbi:MAG: hypothetical protein GEU90_17750 [Gemmatimonas sp.]|nr:hypothetical protein [Gemmatimonas sp.]
MTVGRWQTAGADGDMRIHWATLSEADISVARDDGALVIVPLGAVEQHGAHLPVNTDIAIAAAVADEVARRLGNSLVTPPIHWGYSSSHMGFTGTISLRPGTLQALLEDICGSLVTHGFEKVTILSSHGTNRPIAQIFVREFHAATGKTVSYVHYTDFGKQAFNELRKSEKGGEMHAGEFETALQMFLNPELVDLSVGHTEYVHPERHFGIASASRDITEAGRISFGYDIKSIFPTGVMGDPMPATPELGAALFERIVEGIVQVLGEYRAAP